MNERLSKIYRGFLRYPLNTKNKKRLEASDVTIFSSNCIGGVIYHELDLPFLSPTINLYMDPKDYLKFLQEPPKYFGKEMTLIPELSDNFPVVRVEDIVLHGVHYHSLKEVTEKWNERAKRINWKNIRVIMVERDGCTLQDLRTFDELPYEHKIVFVHKDMPEIKSSVYIHGTEMDGVNGNRVCDFTTYVGKFSGRRIIDQWDYVSFLNGKNQK